MVWLKIMISMELKRKLSTTANNNILHSMLYVNEYLIQPQKKKTKKYFKNTLFFINLLFFFVYFEKTMNITKK